MIRHILQCIGAKGVISYEGLLELMYPSNEFNWSYVQTSRELTRAINSLVEHHRVMWVCGAESGYRMTENGLDYYELLMER